MKLRPGFVRGMRYVLSVCLVPLCVSLSCAGDVVDGLSSLDKDKYVHFGAGVLLSHVSYPLLKHYIRDGRKAMWYSVAITAAVSAGKEIYDSSRTGFDGGDLSAGVLGGCTIFVVEFD